MSPGLSDDLQQIDDARKTAIIDRELKRLNVDIAALQETRLPCSGSLKERERTHIYTCMCMCTCVLVYTCVNE